MNSIFSAFVAIMFASCLLHASEPWLTNVETAKEKAKKENKGLLIEFTGSDWCGPCIALKKDVLDKVEFDDAVKNDYVLVKLDFPERKLSEKEREYNSKYAEEYGVDGFPTIVFTDREGKPYYVFSGYSTLDRVLEEIKSAAQARENLKQLTEKAGGEKGPGLYKEIGAFFEPLPYEYYEKFHPVLFNILKDDADDVSGIRHKARSHRENELLNAFRTENREKFEQDPKTSASLIDQFLEENDFLPETEQTLMLWQGYFLMKADEVDESLAKYKEALARCPDSSNAPVIIKQIEDYEKDLDNLRDKASYRKDFNAFNDALSPEVRYTPDLFIKAVEQYMADRELSNYARQELGRGIAYTLLIDDRFREALRCFKDTIAIDPDSELGKYMAQEADELQKNEEKIRSVMKERRALMDQQKEKEIAEREAAKAQ